MRRSLRLPNIYGDVSPRIGITATGTIALPTMVSDAFTAVKATYTFYNPAGSSTTEHTIGAWFSAHSCNATYVNNASVHPLSLVLNYIIKA